MFCCVFFLRRRRPPSSKLTDTLFPYTPLFRSVADLVQGGMRAQARGAAGARARVCKAGGRLAITPPAGRTAPARPRRWPGGRWPARRPGRSEEHTSELQSLMRISYAVFCLKKKTKNKNHIQNSHQM